MKIRHLIPIGLAALMVAGLGAGLYYYRDAVSEWLALGNEAEETNTGNSGDSHSDEAASARVHLSPEAQANLQLRVKALKLQTYWRSIEIPGMVIDRPGRSDRGITAPVGGVVKTIHTFPGDTVRPGEPLLTLRVVSETVVTAQTELFKTTRELQLVQEQKDRLGDLTKSGAVPEIKILEIENQFRRLKGLIQAYRQDLLARGLTVEQINGVQEGQFVTEITVAAPKQTTDSRLLVNVKPSSTSGDAAKESDLAFEIQELKVQLGEQVQAGQMLGLLANHRNLFIEGRGFRHEANQIEHAAQQNWPLEADFQEDDDGVWPEGKPTLKIRYLANTLDPNSKTFPFYIPLTNSARPFQADEKTFLIWRFRPGQRVRLRVPIEQFPDMLVLPVDAVARQGPNAYVFRQNGDWFERKSVQVVFEDRLNAVIAPAPGIGPGVFLAHSGAASLKRMVKAAAEGEPHEEHGHGHSHAGHSHDH